MLTAYPAAADWRTDSGWDDLKALLGSNTPDGTGVLVLQAEAGGSNYRPNPTGPQLNTKTFTLQSGASGNLGHATRVARFFYGTENAGGSMNSIGQGVTDIHLYEANSYLNAFGNGNILAERKVHNHSWVGDYPDNTSAATNLEIFDEEINAKGFLLVAGLNNGSDKDVNDIFATTFNAISVGRSNGAHSRNGTIRSSYVPGRIKPEIVSNGSFTSYSTGQVSGVAAALYEVAAANSNLSNAHDNSEVMKAILMAGAVKDKFPTWARTTTQPIDSIYGAGEVNILNSYLIMIGGDQDPGSVPLTGWDFNTLVESNNPNNDVSSRSYDITIPTGELAQDLSIVLNWNHSGNSNPIDLNLTLERIDSPTSTTALDSSDSPVDNVEHVYYRNLPSGSYRLTVNHPSGLTGNITTEFALAWQTQLGRGPHAITSASGTGNPLIAVSVLFKGKTHVIERTYDLASGPWIPVHTFSPSEWESYTWEDPAGVSATEDGGFYRIRWTTP